MRGAIDPNNLGRDPLTRFYHRTLLFFGIKREITWILFDSLSWATLLWIYGALALGMVLGDALDWKGTFILWAGILPAVIMGHVFWAGRKRE